MTQYRHICPVCGDPFFGSYSKKYCSDACVSAKSGGDIYFIGRMRQARREKEARAARLAARDAEWETFARENGVAPRIEERDRKVIETRGQVRIASWATHIGKV